MPCVHVFTSHYEEGLGCTQLCIQNMGRPAAAAVTDVVRGAVSAARAGLSLERLRLQLEYSGDDGEGAVDATGYRLTQSERCYRLQWLDTVCAEQRQFELMWADFHPKDPPPCLPYSPSIMAAASMLRSGCLTFLCVNAVSWDDTAKMSTRSVKDK